MPMPRTRRGRTQQIFRWLVSEYPPPYPVTLSIRAMKKSEKMTGETSWIIGGELLLELDAKLVWIDVI